MLTNTQCKNAKPKDKAYKLSDNAGLYLYITVKGKKSWRYNYKIKGKYKTYTYGLYPEFSLQEAREKHAETHKLVSEGVDPHDHEKKQAVELQRAQELTFKAMAEEWLDKRQNEVKPRTHADIKKRLEKDVFPAIGDIAIKDIDPPVLLAMLKAIEARGAFEMAGRARQYTSKIMRYAVACGEAKRDYTLDISDALAVKKTKHQPALSPDEIPEFIEALNRNDARLRKQTRLALEMLMLTFVRPIELVSAEWQEIRLDEKRWIIPASKMKMGLEHVVPLAERTLEILSELHEMNGSRQHIFPKTTKPSEHMHRDTLSKAVRSLGFQGRHSAHGFRALGRTAIREKLHWESEIIEKQLSHAPNTSLGRAYDRTQFIDQRIKMMQEWADYLGAVGSKGKVVVGNFRKTG